MRGRATRMSGRAGWKFWRRLRRARFSSSSTSSRRSKVITLPSSRCCRAAIQLTCRGLARAGAVHVEADASVHELGQDDRQGFRSGSRQLAKAGRAISHHSKRHTKREQAMQVNPYLFYDGNCDAAFKFYEKVLGAKIEMMLTHEAAPESMPTPPEWKNKIMHGRLTIDGQVLMASDAPPGHFNKPQGFAVSLTAATRPMPSANSRRCRKAASS